MRQLGIRLDRTMFKWGRLNWFSEIHKDVQSNIDDFVYESERI